ncbi:hypothetical protein [Nocardia tengchongensis]|uniref:hypothetical protein n=1 Tax=Nocardia tengchongensis TaxID=2055889 RepID=UPI00364704A6
MSGPCLIWSNNHGNYMFSSGLPALTDPDDPQRPTTIRARGALGEPNSAVSENSAVGGSDFYEFLPLTDSDGLADIIGEQARRGAQWLVLTVTDMDYDTNEPGEIAFGFE